MDISMIDPLLKLLYTALGLIKLINQMATGSFLSSSATADFFRVLGGGFL